jgi:LysM repeat protein
MAAVAFLLPGQPPDVSTPQVTLAGPRDTVTLPITDPKVDHSNVGDEYVQQRRPGPNRQPLLLHAAKQLAVEKLSVILAQPDGSSVEDLMSRLKILAGGGGPITVGYAHYEAGQFEITDLSFSTELRSPIDNAIVRATADITLTSANPQPVPQQLKAPPPPPPAPPASAPAPPTVDGARRYTVKSGDTLFAIAQRTYGNGNLWRRIADANHLKNPNRIAAGQVLTLP